jgi:hypothetical protein
MSFGNRATEQRQPWQRCGKQDGKQNQRCRKSDCAKKKKTNYGRDLFATGQDDIQVHGIITAVDKTAGTVTVDVHQKAAGK